MSNNLTEWVQVRLAAVTAVCGGLMIVGGVFCKSSRWSTTDGAGMGWIDGVKPWAIFAFLGGLAILGLLGAGWWAERWLVPALAAIPLFVLAATMAMDYRDRLEASIVDHPLYVEQNLALGLRIVPIVGLAGAISAGLLAVVSLVIHLDQRRAGWPLAAR